MKNILKLEELLMLALAIYLFTFLDYNWWLFAAFFLAPDLGMLGYLANAKIGAFTYNITHHKGIAIASYLSGTFFDIPVLMFAGLILFAHSSFDRVLGYGLKYSDNFKNTHLGTIGRP
ncbi:MAG TPA: DUF4260 domain-containing protein [Ignavibacteria bacterium]|nr:DUF4260 domain-containing protein [Ignavibacteria bacterium]HMQ98061.1 DUF4260 domain-containing protein [Ignavibacteria bacterium]